MFLLICKLYICIQNVFGHIFYKTRLHLYWQFWQFEVQKLAYMLLLAAGGMIPYLSSVDLVNMYERKSVSRSLRNTSAQNKENTVLLGRLWAEQVDTLLLLDVDHLHHTSRFCRCL